MSSLDDFARDKLAALDARGQRRAPIDTRRLPGGRVERVVSGARRTLIDFSSNDTLGLSHDDAVIGAARAALDDGVGSGGSRLVSGGHPALSRLEHKLATRKHKEAALVTGSGWLANVGVVPALVGAGDVVVIDALAHASLFAGARLSRADVRVFAHNDVADLRRVLAGARVDGVGGVDGAGAHGERRVLVVTESVFSMDGDRAPLAAVRAAADAFAAWVVVDDAHGFLVSDDDEERAVAACADVVTGTLSKAVGGYGGVVAGSRVVCDLLFTRCRPVLFGTALPAAVVAAADAGLDVAASDPARRARPRALATRFCRALDLPAPASHIVPLVVGDEARAMSLMHGLVDDGFLVVAIRPPTVPAGTSRLRVGFSAVHADDDVDGLVAALQRRWRRS